MLQKRFIDTQIFKTMRGIGDCLTYPFHFSDEAAEHLD